ncbi:MAG: adenosylcobinamide-GDP ribazoletransferase, partial [Propionibacteriaceae bacterium]|nr:adenosylcobinamide-GDP ribazoletransferase [Propionibacteriaceae bacterium]
IMRRSDIGPMGVISLLFVLLADVAAITRLTAEAPLAAPLALVCAAILGRVAVVAATTPSSTGARSAGFGALFYGVTSTATATLWGIAGLATAVAVGWVVAGLSGAAVFGVAALVSMAVGWWWRRHLSRRLGGMTGDAFGSIIEVVMAAFLVAATLGFGIVTLA